MGDKRSDTNHFRLEVFNKTYILYQKFHSLVRGSHHDACPGLETDSFEFLKAFDTSFVGHFIGVQTVVMPSVECFVA